MQAAETGEGTRPGPATIGVKREGSLGHGRLCLGEVCFGYVSCELRMGGGWERLLTSSGTGGSRTCFLYRIYFQRPEKEEVSVHNKIAFMRSF